MIEKSEKTNGVQQALSRGPAVQSPSERGLLLEPYRGELLLHGYRLLGARHNAEDAVQETMLRAWRHFDTFTEKGPGSLCTWLYTIATNTSLDILKKRSPRTLPIAASLASDPTRPVAPRNAEVPWLEPFPDSWLVEATENPEARYTRHESVSLAFLTALQMLPPRQHAILLLADVLDWHASEIAQLLEVSASAVKSALHRARMTLEKNYPHAEREMAPTGLTDAATNALLARYLQTWETDDVDGLIALLKKDATLSMPPVPSWYQGREAIRAFSLAILFPSGIYKLWRLLPTRANGQPDCVVYRANEATGSYRAFAFQVITLDGLQLPRQVAGITALRDTTTTASLVCSLGQRLSLSQNIKKSGILQPSVM